MAALSLGERVPEERGQERGYLVSGGLDATLGCWVTGNSVSALSMTGGYVSFTAQ